MKRMHIHVSVENLDQSVRFYSALFASEPTLMKPDHAKWMLDDPRVNFAVSKRGAAPGLNHLGVTDPQGIAWETFHTLDAIPVHGADAESAKASNCCIPLSVARASDSCCVPTASSSSAGCCS
jgi:hypothetical protein